MSQCECCAQRQHQQQELVRTSAEAVLRLAEVLGDLAVEVGPPTYADTLTRIYLATSRLKELVDLEDAFAVDLPEKE